MLYLLFFIFRGLIFTLNGRIEPVPVGESRPLSLLMPWLRPGVTTKIENRSSVELPSVIPAGGVSPFESLPRFARGFSI